MKRQKAFIFFFLTSFLFLNAQENGKPVSDNQKAVGYSTSITTLISWPPEALLGVTENFTVPVLNYDNPLTKDNNITFKLGAELTPVAMESKFGITWTPAAFFELYTEGRIGTGWKLNKEFLGVGINENDNGVSALKPADFTKGVYSFTLGGAFQFDLGAVIPNDWTHVIFRIDQFALYKGMTGTGNLTSWIYQADYGTNRNGWRYGASYVAGYKMPIPLNLIALKVDTEKSFFAVPAGLDKRTWGEDRFVTTIGPVLNFVIKKDYNIMLLAQWKFIPAVVREQTDNGDYVFYQTHQLDPQKHSAVRLRRISIIFYVTINNQQPRRERRGMLFS